MSRSDDQAALTARIFLLLSASGAVLSVAALSSGSLLVRRICCTDSFCSARYRPRFSACVSSICIPLCSSQSVNASAMSSSLSFSLHLFLRPRILFQQPFCTSSTVIIYSIAVPDLRCSKNVRTWLTQRMYKPGAVIGTAFFLQSGSAKWTAILPASAGQVYPAPYRTDGPRFQRIR